MDLSQLMTVNHLQSWVVTRLQCTLEKNVAFSASLDNLVILRQGGSVMSRVMDFTLQDQYI